MITNCEDCEYNDDDWSVMKLISDADAQSVNATEADDDDAML
jgi:hypothetical protein